MKPRLVALWLSLALPGAAAAQVRVEASVDANTVGVEDALQLTVSVEGGSGEPRLVDVPGFRVQGRSTSSQVSIVNGRMSTTNAYIYTLVPEGEGRFTIEPIEVIVDGQSFRTEPIEVTIVPGSVRARGRSSLNPYGGSSSFPFGGRRRAVPELDADDVFLRAEVQKDRVFLGEPIVVTYSLYSRFVPLGPQIEDDPPLTGFWVEEIDREGETRPERRVVDGREYLVFPLIERVLFPTAAGTAEVPALTLSTAFRMTSSDPFDSFFSRGSRPISVRSPPVPIEVRDLPEEGRPHDFSGAVGSYSLSAKLGADAAALGEAVTLTLSITGGGNFRSLAAPEVPDAPGFRRFDPKTEESVRASRAGLEGSKTWEYVLVPESPGTKELGPWRFSYFDPGAGLYRTSTAGPLSLTVSGDVTAGAGSPLTGASGPAEVKVLREDIRYLKPAPARFGDASTAFHRSPWFFSSLALPLLWNGALVLYRRRKQSELRDSGARRSRRASRVAAERLKKAGSLAARGSKDFYEELASAIYRYIGDKKSMSPSGLTAAAIDELLEDSGVSDGARREFAAVLQACEEARFTPGKRTPEEMGSLLARTEKMLVFLEKQLT